MPTEKGAWGSWVCECDHPDDQPRLVPKGEECPACGAEEGRVCPDAPRGATESARGQFREEDEDAMLRRVVVGPSACGWCGRLVYDWKIQGPAHYDGVCIGNAPGSTDATLNAYHSATAKQRKADRG